MTDQELLQAIGQVVESKIEPLRQDIGDLKDRVGQLESEVRTLREDHTKLEDKVNSIRVYMDTEQKRTLNLLLEGQQALWDRFVPQEEFSPLEDRTQVLELTVRRHSQEIRELQLA